MIAHTPRCCGSASRAADLAAEAERHGLVIRAQATAARTALLQLVVQSERAAA